MLVNPPKSPYFQKENVVILRLLFEVNFIFNFFIKKNEVRRGETIKAKTYPIPLK